MVRITESPAPPLPLDRNPTYLGTGAADGRLGSENEGTITLTEIVSGDRTSGTVAILRSYAMSAHVAAAFAHTGDEVGAIFCEVSEDGGTTFDIVDRREFHLASLSAGDQIMMNSQPDIDLPSNGLARLRSFLGGDANGAGRVHFGGAIGIEEVDAP